ncbi:hypothetical protein HIM_09328 [Hirsutella minnesotensis 3608]|uniref:Methyltransferase domain-containing protein n=1 Tax=Hirsutella minnesotensis 3608 TaxID=1043627 RepID=A0A0F7ZLM3_9HYPO|nr:hypothetical protein HIM_09328 [Hirsutella minnesotensis 3608]
MAGSIKNWPRLFRQIYDNLKPGGWVEFHEAVNTPYSEDNSLKHDDPLAQLMNELMNACNSIGRTWNPAPSFKKWAQEAGFTRIEEQCFKLPVGGWPKDPRLKEIGAFLSINFSEGVDAFTAVPLRDLLGWSRWEVEIFNGRVREAEKRRHIHAISDFLVLTARKPR